MNTGRFTDYPERGKRKIGGSRAWRNNNPGNIVYSKSSPTSKNAIGHDYGGFAVFPTMQDGINAQNSLWHAPAYQNRTLEQAVNSWTSGDPRTTREAYLRDLVTKARVSASAKISTLTEDQLQDLQQAQREHEGRQKGRIIDIPKPQSGGRKK